MNQPRRFHLQRDHDVTGASGTGRVADGVLWPDGTVSIRWTGPMPSTVFWHSLANALHVHGHGGHTRIVWDDPDPVGWDNADQTCPRRTADHSRGRPSWAPTGTATASPRGSSSPVRQARTLPSRTPNGFGSA